MDGASMTAQLLMDNGFHVIDVEEMPDIPGGSA